MVYVFPDCLQDTICVGSHFVVWETQHRKSFFLQIRIAEGISLFSFRRVMLTAVELYHEFYFDGEKIEYVWTEGRLPPEFHAELFSSNLRPEFAFGIRRALSQITRKTYVLRGILKEVLAHSFLSFLQRGERESGGQPVFLVLDPLCVSPQRERAGSSARDTPEMEPDDLPIDNILSFFVLDAYPGQVFVVDDIRGTRIERDDHGHRTMDPRLS